MDEAGGVAWSDLEAGLLDALAALLHILALPLDVPVPALLQALLGDLLLPQPLHAVEGNTQSTPLRTASA